MVVGVATGGVVNAACGGRGDVGGAS